MRYLISLVLKNRSFMLVFFSGLGVLANAVWMFPSWYTEAGR
jgi:hypothetical protein